MTETLIAPTKICPSCEEEKPLSEFHLNKGRPDGRAGSIRGLLCRSCNLMLGNGDDDPQLLRKGADYLESV